MVRRAFLPAVLCNGRRRDAWSRNEGAFFSNAAVRMLAASCVAWNAQIGVVCPGRCNVRKILRFFVGKIGGKSHRR